MLLSHVFIVTPGGVGTLLELFYTWQLMQVWQICRTPIILWWEQYKTLQNYMNNEIMERGFMSPQDAELVIQADTIEQTMELIHLAHNAYEKWGENACINIHQYRAWARNIGLI